MRRALRVAAAIACGSMAGAAAAPTLEPVLDVKSLMNWVLDPATDVVWGAAGWVVTEEGERSLAPTSEEGWAAVRNAGAVVAESGNLLLLPGRARDDGAWFAFSRQIAALGREVIDAAERRDAEAIFDVGGRLYVVCVACHEQYVPARSEVAN